MELDRKSLLSSFVLASLVLLGWTLANLPMHYSESNGAWHGVAELPAVRSGSLNELPTMAGWPSRYWIAYQRPDHGQLLGSSSLDAASPGSPAETRLETRFWSTARLIGNVLLGILVAGLVGAFVGYRDLRIRQSKQAAVCKRRFDYLVATAIVVLPAAAVGKLYWDSVQQQKLIDRFCVRGNCYVSTWLPTPLAKQMPRGLASLFTEIRHVQSTGAGDATAQRIASLESLVHWDSLAGRHSAESMMSLVDRPHLTSIGLTHRDVDLSHLSLIESLPWIKRLSLARTNLDDAKLRLLDKNQTLLSVDLTYTELELSELGDPAWKQSVQELVLTRPDVGQSDTLKIHGWPELRRLSVRRLSAELNESVLRIDLADLDRLESLSLDRTQLHSLKLRNLPRLAGINDDPAPMLFLVQQNLWLPGLGWYEDLSVKDMPSLKSLGCFARDLEEIKLSGVPNLKSLSIGSFVLSSYGGTMAQPADAERCQQWVNELGQGDGPPSVTLTALPLESVDLRPLVQNERIRKLRFVETGITFEGVQRLEGMDDLESLDLGTCAIEANQLDWFLECFPRLEMLRVDGSRLARVELSGRDQLRRIETTSFRQVEQFRVIDQPALQASFRFENAPRTLQISNARSLRGLAVAESWPATAQVEGLRDLRWFAAGGPEVDDELLGKVLDCSSLDQLTLAYPSLSRESLIRIGELTQLTVLVVPGTNVDDRITAEWNNIGNLWEINLDDSSIGVGTLAWLRGTESLRTLSLCRVALDDAALDALSTLRQISELRICEVDFHCRHVEPLIRGDALEVLDVSGCKIEDSLLQAVGDSFSVKLLVARDCGLDAAAVRHWMDRRADLVIDAGLDRETTDPTLLAEIDRRMDLYRRFSRRLVSRAAVPGSQQRVPAANAGTEQRGDNGTRIGATAVARLAENTNRSSQGLVASRVPATKVPAAKFASTQPRAPDSVDEDELDRDKKADDGRSSQVSPANQSSHSDESLEPFADDYDSFAITMTLGRIDTEVFRLAKLRSQHEDDDLSDVPPASSP